MFDGLRKEVVFEMAGLQVPAKKDPIEFSFHKAQKRHSSKVPKAVKKRHQALPAKKTRIIISTGLLPVIVIAVSTASVTSQRSQHKKANRLYCMNVWV